MASPAASGTSPRHWLISSPRTASSMLMRILNLDDQGVRPTTNGGYFFLPSILARYAVHSKPMAEWSDEEKQNIEVLAQNCFDDLCNYLGEAEREGQKVFIKEHALLVNHPFIESESIHGNGTATAEPTPLVPRGHGPGTRSTYNRSVFSDQFLKTWTPTFLIRHPAMTFPSLYRMVRREGFNRENNEPHALELTTQWQRSLYDFYSGVHQHDQYQDQGQDQVQDQGQSQHETTQGPPIVLDADDIMQDPKLLAKYAGIVGLDPDKLRFTWEKMPREQVERLPPMARGATGSLIGSEKVDLGKVAGDIDVDVEAAKWREEFGEESGAKLERLVRDCMGDYEYMRSKRLTLD